MRKLILEIKPNDASREAQKSLFQDIHSYEVLEMLKIDYEKGMCVDLIECVLKEGKTIDDVKYIGHMEILNVLKSEGNKHTCLIKYYEPEGSKNKFKETDLDLILTKPSIVSEDKLTVSFIGAQDTS